MLLTLEKGIKPVSDDVKKLSTHTVITLILSFFFFSQTVSRIYWKDWTMMTTYWMRLFCYEKKNKDIDNVSVSNGI